MTETALKQIVQRAVRDGSFRAQLRSDPAKALAGIGLTAEEQAALTSGDPARLTALGIDQRMSKAFSVGLLSDASKAVIATDAGEIGTAFVDEGSDRGGNAVIVGDPLLAAAPATLVQDVQSLSDLHMKLNEQDLNTGAAAVEADVENTGAAAVEADVETVRSPMWRVEQDLDASNATSGFLTQDEELIASRPEPSGTERSPMWKVEQDLDAGASLEAPADIQITGDDTISEN